MDTGSQSMWKEILDLPRDSNVAHTYISYVSFVYYSPLSSSTVMPYCAILGKEVNGQIHVWRWPQDYGLSVNAYNCIHFWVAKVVEFYAVRYVAGSNNFI